MKFYEQNVRAALDEVVGGESLNQWEKQRIVYNALRQGRRGPARWKKRLVSCIVVAVVACLSTTAVFAAVPSLADRLSMLSHQTLRYLKPVEQSCTDNGLEVEVMAAMNDGDTAVTFVKLHDLTGTRQLSCEGDRIDCEVLGLGDGCYSYVENVFQQSGGDLVLRVLSQTDGTSTIGNEEVAFSMEYLLTGFDWQENVDTGYTVADIQQINPNPSFADTEPICSSDFYENGDGIMLSDRMEEEGFAVLSENSGAFDSPVPWAELLNAGVRNGMLYLLLKPDLAYWYNELELYFADADGERILEDWACIRLGEQGYMGNMMRQTYSEYVEYVLVLPEGYTPEQLYLHYNAGTYETCVTGNWHIPYVLQEETDAIVIPCDKKMNGWTLLEAKVSPVGVTLTGVGEIQEMDWGSLCTAYLDDGTRIVDFTGSLGYTAWSEEQQQYVTLIKSMPEEPIDLSRVQSVRVKGKTIWSRAG